MLGLLCAREPVLRTRYANVGGELVKPLLMQKSWWELVQLAGFIDVDITRCEQRADIIQALIKFPGPLVSDMDGLMYLYEDTGGSSWRNSSNWGSSRPLREWYGVRTNDAGRVVELRLQNEKLRGTCCVMRHPASSARSPVPFRRARARSKNLLRRHLNPMHCYSVLEGSFRGESIMCPSWLAVAFARYRERFAGAKASVTLDERPCSCLRPSEHRSRSNPGAHHTSERSGIFAPQQLAERRRND